MTAPPAPTEHAALPPIEHLQGIVERVTYHAGDSGYTVARLKVPASLAFGATTLNSGRNSRSLTRRKRNRQP